jgi:cobalt/nickel transport system ATP-binding protein
MIAIEGLHHDFDGTPTLVDVSFELKAGEKAVLLGCNGCGKSTLLKILDGLIEPVAGRYRFNGLDVTPHALRDRAFQARFRREAALLFQNPDAMIFNPTVRDEIAFGPRQFGLDDPEGRAESWAAELGVAPLLDRAPTTLSTGQKRLVCLASLLVLDPRVLLLDEPTASLDPRSTGWLVDFLQDLELTTLVATHNLSLATELGERCLVLGENHRLLHDGDVLALRDDHAVLKAANLVHVHRHRHRDGGEHRHYHTHDWD